MLRNRPPARAERWIGPLLAFFVVAWLLTFNAAYVNGDDFLPLAKAELRNAFVPNFKHDWVPNRMLDAYGRDLLAAGFDLGFFSLRTIVPVDFFLLYKAYVATVFAAFLTIALRYLWRTAMTAAGPARGVDNAVIGGFLAVVVLGLFPWRNQTFFVAYQLAAFLCFVLLNEVTRRLVALAGRDDGDAGNAAHSVDDRYPGLILLSFVCAFSLEAYAAIVLLALLLPAGIVLRGLRRARPEIDGSALDAGLQSVALVIFAAIAFCGLAVVVTLVTSQRADVVAAQGGFDITGLADSGVAWLGSRRGVIAVVLCAIPLGIASLLASRSRKASATASAPVAASATRGRRRDPQTWIYLSATVVVVVASLAVTLVVSHKAQFDYFAHASYPWGAFLLVAKLFATCAVVVIAMAVSRPSVALRSALLLLAFMAASKGALDVLGTTYASHRTSAQLHGLYRTLGTADGVVDSGLDVASIPMQARPLPTADSPEWFAAAFTRFAKKYYDVTGRFVFR